MIPEAQNAFQRARAKVNTAPVDDKPRNRFDRLTSQRIDLAKEAHEADVKARIERNAEQKTVWQGPGRKQRSAVGSTTLNTDLQHLKQASDASREAERAPKVEQPAYKGQPLTETTLAAVVLQWQKMNPQYADTKFNGENFNRALQEYLKRGGLFSYEALDNIYAYLHDGGFLETTGLRSRGDFATRSAAQEYPIYVSDEEHAAEAQRVAEVREKTDEEQARSMSFSELQKAVRAGFKDTRPANIRGAR